MELYCHGLVYHNLTIPVIVNLLMRSVLRRDLGDNVKNINIIAPILNKYAGNIDTLYRENYGNNW
jgi:predicted nucleotidyltransferase